LNYNESNNKNSFYLSIRAKRLLLAAVGVHSSLGFGPGHDTGGRAAVGVQWVHIDDVLADDRGRRGRRKMASGSERAHFRPVWLVARTATRA